MGNLPFGFGDPVTRTTRTRLRADSTCRTLGAMLQQLGDAAKGGNEVQ